MSSPVILSSNFRPVLLKKNKTFSDAFSEYADRDTSDLIKISVGFISIDSILFLLENIRRNTIKGVELTIGMHAFSGFTRPQYAAVLSLDNELRKRNIGWVKLCTAFSFHGKVYSFWKQGSPLMGIIGSSNLDNLLKDDHTYYEVDLLFDDTQALNETAKLQKELSDNASKTLQEWEPNFIQQPLFHLKHPDVEELDRSQLSEHMKLGTDKSFLLELKSEAKSNLNVTFAKGRENKRTKVIRPRPWYEVEIIVGAKITSQKGYPKGIDFQVVTDDGYKFWCQTSGDYNKNFRSKNDLRILGMWIKGKMEASGALQVGQPVTESILQEFGKRNIKLTATKNPALWLAELV